MSKSMPIRRFDYNLPPESVAQRPLEPRSAARLLDASGPRPVHRRVFDLPRLVGEGDVVVVNETRVLPGRLRLVKSTGGAVEVLLVEEREGYRFCPEWEALVRPSRRVRSGTVLLDRVGGSPVLEVGPAVGEPSWRSWVKEPCLDLGDPVPSQSPAGGLRLVRLLDPTIVDRLGQVPLPPYIHEPLADPERYQTVYGKVPGSVAAPTAGLHLTDEVLSACQANGASIHRVDLSVGLGTFRPITAAKVEDHIMHSERYRVPEETLAACKEARRVLAVGTTTLRALESAAATGCLQGRTSLYIHGDFSFLVVDVLLTNFHLPRSSLLVLLESFYGPGWRELYELALEQGYRFASFGDAMLVARRELTKETP